MYLRFSFVITNKLTETVNHEATVAHRRRPVIVVNDSIFEIGRPFTDYPAFGSRC